MVKSTAKETKAKVNAKVKPKVKTQETSINIDDEFSSLDIKTSKKKVNSKKKPVLWDYDKSSKEFANILESMVKDAVKDAKRDESKVDFTTGAILSGIKTEPTSLFTAKHFANGLNLSTTAVYNKMDILIKAGQVKVIQLPNRRKYYTSVNNELYS